MLYPTYSSWWPLQQVLGLSSLETGKLVIRPCTLHLELRTRAWEWWWGQCVSWVTKLPLSCLCFFQVFFLYSILNKEIRKLKCEFFNKGIQGEHLSFYTHSVLPSQMRPTLWLTPTSAVQDGMPGCPQFLPLLEAYPPLKIAFSLALVWQRGSKWPLEYLPLWIRCLYMLSLLECFCSANLWEMPIRWELFNIISVSLSLSKKRNHFYKDQL